MDEQLPEVGEIVIDIVGTLVKVHTNKDRHYLGLYVSIRSRIYITKPIRRIARVRLGSDDLIVSTNLRNENLLDFWLLVLTDWLCNQGVPGSECPM